MQTKNPRSQLLAGGLVTAIAMLCTEIHAQIPALYVSGDLGQSRYNDISVVQNSSRVVGGQVDRNGTASSVALGWQVATRIGLELGYIDFGKINLGGRASFACQPAPTCTPISGVISGNYKTKTAHVSMVAGIPISDAFSLFGRVGLARSQQSASITIAGLSGTGKANKTEGIFSLGTSYAFTKSVEGVLEWRLLAVSQVNAATLGIRVRF